MRGSGSPWGVIHVVLKGMVDLLYPGRALVFESPLSLEEVAIRLRRELTPPAWQLRDQRRQLFEGTCAEGRFHMIRLVHGRHSFRPVIDGRFSAGKVGTRVEVLLRLDPLLVAFLLILATIAGTIAALATPAIPVLRLISPTVARMLVMVGIFVLVTLVGHVEARTATRLLAKLFESQPSPADTESQPPLSRLP